MRPGRERRRRGAVITVLGGLALVAVGCQPPLGVTLSVTTSKAEYAAGERVELTLVLTNHGPTPVGLSDFPDANLHIVSLTRDGTPVPTRTTSMVYDDDLEAMVRQSLQRVGVGATVTMMWSSWPDDAQNGEQSLTTVEFRSDGDHRATVYVMGAPGAYDIVLQYRFAVPVSPGTTTFEGVAEARVGIRVVP